MRNLFQAGLTFLTFAGLTLAMGMPSQSTSTLGTSLHAISVSPDAIPSAIISHSTEVAFDLPMPQGTMDNGETTNIDLPMPNHGSAVAISS